MSRRMFFVVFFSVFAACSRQTETQLASSIPQETIVPQPEPAPEVDPLLTHEMEQRSIDSLANEAMLLIDDIEFGEQWIRSQYARLHPITSEETWADGSPLYFIPPDALPSVRAARAEAQLRALAFFLDRRFVTLTAETFDRYPLYGREREAIEHAYQERDEYCIRAFLKPHFVDKANDRLAVLTLLSEIERLRTGGSIHFNPHEGAHISKWRLEHDAAIRRLSAHIDTVKTLTSAGPENSTTLFQPNDFWLLSVPTRNSSMVRTLKIVRSSGNVFTATAWGGLSYAGFVLPDHVLLLFTPYRPETPPYLDAHAIYVGRINRDRVSGVAHIHRWGHNNPFTFTLSQTEPEEPTYRTEHRRFRWPSAIGRPFEGAPVQKSVNWFRDKFLTPDRFAVIVH